LILAAKTVSGAIVGTVGVVGVVGVTTTEGGAGSLVSVFVQDDSITTKANRTFFIDFVLIYPLGVHKCSLINSMSLYVIKRLALS
jgi:hypothetical protein